MLWSDHGMTAAAGWERNEKILAGLLWASSVELLAPTTSVWLFAGNWIINSSDEEPKNIDFFFFFPFLMSIKGPRLTDMTAAFNLEGYRAGSASLLASFALLPASLPWFFCFSFPPLRRALSLSVSESRFRAGSACFCPGFFLEVSLWYTKEKRKTKKRLKRDNKMKENPSLCGFKI